MHATTTSREAARPFADVAARWAAVEGRDLRAASAFVYGVRSTGIYCRPGCPSRLPARSHVVFFDTAAQAERAGFRACKRCTPDRAHPRAELVRRVCAYLDAHAHQATTLDAVAAHVHVSPFHLQREFKRALGITPRAYQAARRLERFKAAIQRGASVTRAMHEAGFGSSSRLYDAALRHLGMTPAAYRRKGAGMRIGFTVLRAPIGVVLIAATPRGVCKVALGDDAGRLEAALRAEFAEARIERGGPMALRARASIARYLRDGTTPLDLPRDVQATAFEQRVWDALRAIPPGETRTYGEIAALVGAPRAQRAVGRACARNPLALVVPCHRVLPARGGLGGYVWGTARKRSLLELERGAGQSSRLTPNRTVRR